MRASVAALLLCTTPHVMQPLDRAAIDAVARGAADVFAREYFDEGIGRRVHAAIVKRTADGHYAAAASREDLADRLTRDFFELTRDRHIVVALQRPPGGGSGNARRDVPTSAGFRRTEILPDNVGLLDMAFFLRPAEHQDALAEAMRSLRPAAALILDMRDNGGGSPDTAALLISYVLDTPAMPLFEIVRRDGTKDVYRTTAGDLPGRNGRRPVYVLTSSRTFSAGEGLAFILQELNRAVVVGETTAGAANPGRAYPIDAAFEITVPNGQVLTTVRRRNWEGGGVTPDVRVAAADALAVAQKLASQLLHK